MPVSPDLLDRARFLGHQCAGDFAPDAPLAPSLNVPPSVVTELEALHGTALDDLDLADVEASYAHAVLDARAERGIQVRLVGGGSVLVSGLGDDVSTVAVTLATISLMDTSAKTLCAVLSPVLSRAVRITPITGDAFECRPSGR